jgi:hypothetical protein
VDDAPYSFWSITVFLFASPALLVVSFSILGQYWREDGRIPVYWGCVHLVALCIVATLAFSGLRGRRSSLVLLVIIAIFCWAAAIKLGLDWWKARRAKAAQPD